MWKRDWQIAIWQIAARPQQDPWNHYHPIPDGAAAKGSTPIPSWGGGKALEVLLKHHQVSPTGTERISLRKFMVCQDLQLLVVAVLSQGEPAPFPAGNGAEQNLLLKRWQQGRKAGHGTTTSQAGIF